MRMKFAQLDLKYVVHCALKFLPCDDAILVLINFFHDFIPHLFLFVILFLVLFIGTKFAAQFILSNCAIPIAIENFESSPDVSFIQQGDFVACGRHKFLPSDSTIAILVHLLHHSFVFIGRVLLTYHFLASQGLVHVL
jgi:hypothetical protein